MPYFRVLRKDIYFRYIFVEAESPEKAIADVESKNRFEVTSFDKVVTDEDCDMEYFCGPSDELTKKEFDEKDCAARRELLVESEDGLIINHKCHPMHDSFTLEKVNGEWYLCCYECHKGLVKVGTLQRL